VKTKIFLFILALAAPAMAGERFELPPAKQAIKKTYTSAKKALDIPPQEIHLKLKSLFKNARESA
jgi:hypothetical protein